RLPLGRGDVPAPPSAGGDGPERDALHLVGTAGVERPLGDEAVVVAPDLANGEAGGLDRLQVGIARNRAGDAGGPELDVAPRALLQRAAADDVRDGEPALGAEDAGGLGEDASLGRGQVDHAVGDDRVEARVLEGELLDVGLDELYLGDAAAVAEPRGLLHRIVGHVQ